MWCILHTWHFRSYIYIFSWLVIIILTDFKLPFFSMVTSSWCRRQRWSCLCPWGQVGLVQIQLHSFLMMKLCEANWSTLCCGCSTSGKGSWYPVWGLARPRAVLDILEKKQISCTCQNLNLSLQPHHCTDYSILLPIPTVCLVKLLHPVIHSSTVHTEVENHLTISMKL